MKMSKWIRLSAFLAVGGAMMQFSGCLGDFATGFVAGQNNRVLNAAQDLAIEFGNIGLASFGLGG